MTEIKPDDTANETKEFSDIKNHWGKEAIMHLKKSGIINGVSDDSFAPENLVTRGEFSKMICGAFFGKVSTAESVFEDVSNNAWYKTYVMTLFEKGIICGTGDGKFAPDKQITRQDAAVIMNKTAKAISKKLEKTRESISFADEESISVYAQNAVHTLYEAALINGVGNNKFDGFGYMTRAQAAQLIYNMMK